LTDAIDITIRASILSELKLLPDGLSIDLFAQSQFFFIRNIIKLDDLRSWIGSEQFQVYATLKPNATEKPIKG
jgi:hypothetical protein